MDGLTLTRSDVGVATVTVDRPERRNALDDALLLEALPAAFEELAGDGTVRAVVVTGAPGAFCAGADLDCSGLSTSSPLDAHRFMLRSHLTVQRMRSLPQPIVAAIDGAAVGAGLGLAAACDLRIASLRSTFIAPFLRMGLPPDYGTSYLLPRIVGAEVALDILLSCRTVGAEEAQRIGLVSRLSKNPLVDAQELAATIASHPPHAVGQTKRNVYRGLDTEMAQAVEAEIRSVAMALHSEEFADAFSGWKQQIRG